MICDLNVLIYKILSALHRYVVHLSGLNRTLVAHKIQFVILDLHRLLNNLVMVAERHEMNDSLTHARPIRQVSCVLRASVEAVWCGICCAHVRCLMRCNASVVPVLRCVLFTTPVVV